MKPRRLHSETIFSISGVSFSVLMTKWVDGWDVKGGEPARGTASAQEGNRRPVRNCLTIPGFSLLTMKKTLLIVSLALGTAFTLPAQDAPKKEGAPAGERPNAGGGR